MGSLGSPSSFDRSRAIDFCRDETGQDLVEYSLLAVLISAGFIIIWNYILSSSISTVYYVIVKQIQKVFYGVAW